MRKLFVFVAVVGVGSLGVFFLFQSMSGDRHQVNLALVAGDSTFLYTPMTADAVGYQLTQKQSPMAMPTFEVFADEEELYANPMQCGPLVGILSGAERRHAYQEPSFKGYFTVTDLPTFKAETQQRATEEIGEQEIIYTVTLTNDMGESQVISWSLNSRTYSLKALQNCQVRSFKIMTNPQPGETVISSEKKVVLALQSLVDFFQPQATLTWDKDRQLLFTTLPQGG